MTLVILYKIKGCITIAYMYEYKITLAIIARVIFLYVPKHDVTSRVVAIVVRMLAIV